ncbi:MAG: N-6 DNA methylase, partial [Promethearchaeota archaeon]
SEFMTTYKYSGANYTRKYFGLSQARKLIETFPILDFNKYQTDKVRKLVELKDTSSLISFFKKIKNKN